MKIMIINHYAGSPEMGMEYRPFYLAKEWQKNGHEVIIIAASQAHVRSKQISLSSDYQEKTMEGVNYLWVKTPPYEGNGFARVINMRAFVKFLKTNAKTLAKKYNPDLVIASSTYPLDNYPAHKIACLSGAKYFYEIHDLWPLSPMELGGMSAWHPFILWMQRAENYAYKHADGVISMLPETKDYMSAHGLDLQKWNYIPNGIFVEDWNNKIELNHKYQKIINDLKTNKKILIGYAGGHAISNSLDTIVEAARKMSEINPDIHFVLVGDGIEKENLIRAASGLTNILFLDSIPKAEIPDFLGLMDFLILAWNKSPLYKYGINPNKIFDYMMARKPIIHATDAPNKIVDKADCGLAVEPEHPDAIVEAIENLVGFSAERLLEMGKNGRAYVLQKHDYQILAKKFILAIERT